MYMCPLLNSTRDTVWEPRQPTRFVFGRGVAMSPRAGRHAFLNKTTTTITSIPEFNPFFQPPPVSRKGFLSPGGRRLPQAKQVTSKTKTAGLGTG